MAVTDSATQQSKFENRKSKISLPSFPNHIYSALHVEVLFGNFIMFAVEDFLKPTDGFGDRDVFPFGPGKHFGDVERLAEETLNLACAHNGEFVLWTQFVHAQNRDDVLEIAVALQNFLHAASNIVVLLTDNFGRKRLGG